MTLHHGDCLEVMAGMDPESVDAIVTDPPYGLGFMGKAWDASAGPGDSPMRRRPEHDAVNAGMSRQGGRQWQGLDGQKRQARDAREYGRWCEEWAAAMLRVAKPSAYLLAFGGTRTVHRMTCAIEDAGWVIRDMLVWAYASGFPKSKASLKPAWEPIVMARKPGPLRMLAIDACRIGVEGGGTNCSHLPGPCRGHGDSSAQENPTRHALLSQANPTRSLPDSGATLLPLGVPDLSGRAGRGPDEALGRWPANVILTDPIFDGGVEGVVGGGETSSGKMMPTRVEPDGRTVYGQHALAGYTTIETYGDSGTYSRFFLVPKADRADREPVLGGLPPAEARTLPSGYAKERGDGWTPPLLRANTHPTVKPTDLMRHLVRLVTPTGGTVLDPFLGSGTTALAAEMEGFGWVGIEREAEYVAIAEARLNGVQRGLGLEAS